jgi:urate oxidase
MAAAKLIRHQYGKARVRVLKVLREGETHTVKELTVAVKLSGDFESSYTSNDNSRVVATDTMKNTVHALAKDCLHLETERFAATLASHFVSKYSQVETAVVETSERVWNRLKVWGANHPHSFSGGAPFTPTVCATACEEGVKISSGIEDLLLLKTTASSFEGYPKDEFTTLPETKDRLFATTLQARWDWTREPADYLAANAAIQAALLAPFALNHSPSVQATLFQMGEAALGACAEIERIHLAAPNKHYLLVNLAPFDRENANEIFLPTDEPHGQIEATVARA